MMFPSSAAELDTMTMAQVAPLLAFYNLGPVPGGVRGARKALLAFLA
jgi:hypothetical protein